MNGKTIKYHDGTGRKKRRMMHVVMNVRIILSRQSGAWTKERADQSW